MQKSSTESCRLLNSFEEVAYKSNFFIVVQNEQTMKKYVLAWNETIQFMLRIFQIKTSTQFHRLYVNKKIFESDFMQDGQTSTKILNLVVSSRYVS